MTRLSSATAVRGAGVIALACAALFVTAAPAPAATNHTCTKPAYRKTSVNYGIYAGCSYGCQAAGVRSVWVIRSVGVLVRAR